MKLDLAQSASAHRATMYLAELIEKKSLTLEEAKLIYKEMNPSIYAYEKKGHTFWRSSADLSTEDMAKSIDLFMEQSKEAGYPLPLATDQGWLMEINNEIERSKHHL